MQIWDIKNGTPSIGMMKQCFEQKYRINKKYLSSLEHSQIFGIDYFGIFLTHIYSQQTFGIQNEYIHIMNEYFTVSDIRRGMTSAMTNTGQKKENDNIIWHFLFFKQAFWTVFQIPKVLQSFFILQPDFFVWPLRWGLEILMPVWSWRHIWCQESQPAWGTAQLPKCTTVPTCSHKVLLLVQEDLQHFNAVW